MDLWSDTVTLSHDIMLQPNYEHFSKSMVWNINETQYKQEAHGPLFTRLISPFF